MAQSPASPSSKPRRLFVHYGPSPSNRHELQDLYLVPQLHADGSQAADPLRLVVASPFGEKNSRVKFMPSKVQCTTCQKFEVTWEQDNRRFECQGCTNCPRCRSNNILLNDRKQRDKYRLNCTNCGFATTNMDLGSLQDHIRDSQLHASPSLKITESLLALQQGIRKRENASISQRVVDLRAGKDDEALLDHQREIFERENKKSKQQAGDDEDFDELAVANMTFSASSQAARQFGEAHELATKELLTKARPGKLANAPLLSEIAAGAFVPPVAAPFPVPELTSADPNRQVHHRDPSANTKTMIAQGSGVTLDKVCASRGTSVPAGSSGGVNGDDDDSSSQKAAAREVIPYKLLRSYPKIEDTATQMPLYTPSSVTNLSGDLSATSVEKLISDKANNAAIDTWLNATRHLLTIKPMADWRQKASGADAGATTYFFALCNPAAESRVDISRFKLHSSRKGYSVKCSLNVDGVDLGGEPLLLSHRPHNTVVQEFVNDAIADEIAKSPHGCMVDRNKLYFRCDIAETSSTVAAASATGEAADIAASSSGVAKKGAAWLFEIGINQKIQGRATSTAYFAFVA